MRNSEQNEFYRFLGILDNVIRTGDSRKLLFCLKAGAVLEAIIGSLAIGELNLFRRLQATQRETRCLIELLM